LLRRPNPAAAEKPQGWKASLALHFPVGSCRVANIESRDKRRPVARPVARGRLSVAGRVTSDKPTAQATIPGNSPALVLPRRLKGK
jgi:hypothetical protein